MSTSTEPARQNDISERQNSREMLTVLRAKSAAYDRAQLLYYAQIGLAVGLPVALAITRLAFPTLSTAVSVAGLLILFFDAAAIDPRIKRARFLGASFQEIFDCELFQLRWPEAKMGPRPCFEDVDEWASKCPMKPELRNWYAPEVARLPLPLARIACQRSNGKWNSGMRRRYASLLFVVAAVAVAAAVAGAAFEGLTVVEMLEWLATLSPLLVWTLRERQRQRDSAEQSVKVVERARKLWNAGVLAPDFSALEHETRELQNDIYDQRRNDPPVLGFIYSRYRDRDERSMRVGVAGLVEEYEARAAVPYPTIG